MNSEVEQARKKGHLYLITDTAIDKITKLNIFNSWQDEELQKMNQFPDDEKRQESAAKDFLGQVRKVGIRYVKAKE